MENGLFDPVKELEGIRKKRIELKRKTYRKSKLTKYRSELVAMRQAGASGQDLAIWLRSKHRLQMHRSSIERYLSALPELAPAIVTTTQNESVTSPKPDSEVQQKTTLTCFLQYPFEAR